MIQSYTTFPEDTGKHPQPETPPTAALSVVPSLYLAQQGGGQDGQDRLGRAWDVGSGPIEKGGGRRAGDRGAMNSCE